MTHSITMSRDRNGKLNAETRIPLGFDRRELHVYTYKGLHGLICSASVMQASEDGASMSHVFGTGPNGDFRRTLQTDPKARATEKAIRTMHFGCLEGIEDVLAAARAHYEQPASEADTKPIGHSLDPVLQHAIAPLVVAP